MAPFRMVFWDVQHGNAAYLKTPNGNNFVIDLGTGSYSKASTFSPLQHLRYSYGITSLDGAVITHPHADHIADIFAIDELDPNVLIRPNHLSEDEIRQGNRREDNDVVEKYLEVSTRYTDGVAAGQSPFDAANNGGVELQFFSPSGCSTNNLNNHSVITIASFAGSKIIIPGDNEPPSWNDLLTRFDFRTAIAGTDILLAAHHGRDSGFSESLFHYITPKLTIISDGPFGDTSATDRYACRSTGWTVHRRSNSNTQERNCVTTRNDRVIVVEFGTDEGKPYIYVEVE